MPSLALPLYTTRPVCSERLFSTVGARQTCRRFLRVSTSFTRFVRIFTWNVELGWDSCLSTISCLANQTLLPPPPSPSTNYGTCFSASSPSPTNDVVRSFRPETFRSSSGWAILIHPRPSLQACRSITIGEPKRPVDESTGSFSKYVSSSLLCVAGRLLTAQAQ